MSSVGGNVPITFVKLWINLKPSPRYIYYILNVTISVLIFIVISSTLTTFNNGRKYIHSQSQRSVEIQKDTSKIFSKISRDYKANLHHVEVFDRNSMENYLRPSLYEMSGSPRHCTGQCTNENFICKSKPQSKFLSKQVWYQQPQWGTQHTQGEVQAVDAGAQNYYPRLIPRIIHQSWFKHVNSTEHPNLSRIQNSWKSTGWEYRFYDDESAAKYIAENFPKEVFQAYDALLPGAFKADLFRYCALFHEGGVWADIDMQLQINLDNFIEDQDGFIVPLDVEGHALHNALMMSAPGHPILAKAIEEATNMIRNRYTIIDIAGRYCPSINRTLFVTHGTLFLTGPGLLAYAMKETLGRPLSEPFQAGVINSVNSVSMPGRTKILDRITDDLGETRYTDTDKNLIVAGTDIQDGYDGKNKREHYSQTRSDYLLVWGLEKLYKDRWSADERIQIQLFAG